MTEADQQIRVDPANYCTVHLSCFTGRSLANSVNIPSLKWRKSWQAIFVTDFAAGTQERGFLNLDNLVVGLTGNDKKRMADS